MFGPGVTINVTTWGACGLDLIDRSDITVMGRPTITFTGTRGTHISIPSYRGSAGYVNGCGVYANRDRIRIQGLRTIGMPLGVFLSSWNGTSSIDRVGVNNVIEDVECEGANFGILWVGQKGMRINNLYVHDDIDDSLGANPTHAYYSSAAAGMHCSDIIISNVVAENILNGQAFQLKFCDNVRLSNHLARNCKGLFNGMDITDLTSDGMGITNSLINIGLGSLTFQSVNKRIKLNNTFITMAADQNDRAVSIIADDSEINSLTVTPNRPSGASVSQYEVVIRGNNNRYSGLTILSRGAVHCWPLAIGYSGIACNNLLLEDFVFESTRGFGYVLDGNVGIVLKYNPGAQKDIIDGHYLATISGGSADYVISRNEYERIYTANASNASPRPNPYLETRSVIAITDASAIGIGAPKGANPPTGTMQEIIVQNQTAGSLGSVTWNAAYVLAATYTAPAAGASTFHKFRFNGTNWTEVTQSAATQSGGGASPTIQTFTASGTWTKPAGAKLVQVTCIAGGGGGGSGRRDAASTVRCGGGGGAGGNVSQGTYPADSLPSTVAVVVGNGGTGGAAVTTDTTNGNPGTVGGTSAFNVYLRAGGGAFGAGGTASTGTGGSGAINGGFASSNGGSASTTGGVGGGGANSGMGGAGGGAGGGIISASETSAAGGAGGNALAIQNVPATAGTAGGGTGANGANVVAGSAVPGAGGAGGGANTSGAGGNGGTGGSYGAGGGGGGASTNGNASGAGGNGAPGVVQVITYY